MSWHKGLPDSLFPDYSYEGDQVYWLHGSPSSPLIQITGELTVTGSVGIASGIEFGVGSVQLTTQVLTGTAGIASEEAFGVTDAIVIGPLRVSGSAGLPSAFVFGVGGILTGPLVGSSGIGSLEEFGVGGIVANGTLTRETGLASDLAFGLLGASVGGSISGPLVGALGIPSQLFFGVAGGVVAGPVTGDAGIPSDLAFGSGGDIKFKVVGVTGIPSDLIFGAGGVLLRAIEGVGGIESEEAFGTTGTILSFSAFAGSEVSNFALFINGVLRTGYLVVDSVRGDRQLNFVSSASFELEDSQGNFNPSIGDEVIIYHFDEDIIPDRPGTNAWDRIYAGTIESIQISAGWAGESRRRLSVTCVDYGRSLSKRIINKTYPASTFGTLKKIMEDLANTVLAEEGISWDAATAPDTDIADISFVYLKGNEVLDKIADLVGGTWLVDFYKVLRIYTTPNLESAPFDVVQDSTGNNAYLWSDLTVTYNRGLFRNRQYVKNASASSGASAGDPTTVTPAGMQITEEYTFPTFNIDANEAYHYGNALRPVDSIFLITQDDAQFWSAGSMPRIAPTVYDSAYDDRVYGIFEVKWNGVTQTFTRTSTPATPGAWVWNDDRSWCRRQTNPSASQVHNAELFFAGRINDPHNVSLSLPVDTDTVEVTWILDSPSGSHATSTFTFPTFNAGIMPDGGKIAATEDDLKAVFMNPLIYWPEVRDYRYDSKSVLGVVKVYRNGVAEVAGPSGLVGADWIWIGGGRIVNANRHSLTGGSPPRMPANGDVIKVVWNIQAPEVPAEVDETTEGENSIGIVGIWEDVAELADVSDPVLVQQYTQALLEKFGVIGIEVDFSTLRKGFAPGQETTVNLPKYSTGSIPATVETMSFQEEQARVLRYNVKVSNQVQQRDALAAFSRLIAKLKQAQKQIKSTITFHLAETIQGLTNPGLITGTNLATAFIARRNITLIDAAVYFKTPPTGADVKIDLKVDGVSCLNSLIVYPAGATVLTTFSDFKTPPYNIGAGSIVTVDVTQVGSAVPGKDCTLVLTGWV